MSESCTFQALTPDEDFNGTHNSTPAQWIKWLLMVKYCMINKPLHPPHTHPSTPHTPPSARLGRARERRWYRFSFYVVLVTFVSFWGWCRQVVVPLPETLNQATSLTCPTFSSAPNHILGIFRAGELEVTESRWKAKHSSSCHSSSTSPALFCWATASFKFSNIS